MAEPLIKVSPQKAKLVVGKNRNISLKSCDLEWHNYEQMNSDAHFQYTNANVVLLK